MTEAPVRLTAPVTAHREVAAGYRELVFRWEGPAPLPGQFLTVRTTDGPAPTLRRPFAYSRHDPDTGEAALLYELRGPGTRAMARLEPGDRTDLLGPLGTAFPTPEDDRRPVIAGGGIGTGPVLMLAEALHAAGRKPLLVVGCRTASLIPHDILPAGPETALCTDDGSHGFAGNVRQYLESRDDLGAVRLYACGPHPMMAACHDLAVEREWSCSVSLEEMMACAVGACMGCAVAMADGIYRRVCKDGPVFESRELTWT